MTEEKVLTGYPSIDKPWLKWYKDDARNLPECDDINIYHNLRNVSNNRLKNVAIDYFGKKYSFYDLFGQVDKTANAFWNLGVREKDIVTLSLPNIPENVFCFYALNKIGAVANFIDLRLKGEKLIEAINSTNSSFIVATDMFSAELDEVVKCTTLKNVVIASPGDSLPPLVKQLYFAKNRKCNLNNIDWIPWKSFLKSGRGTTETNCYKETKKDAACILHTSGTTGTPKGVVLTNEVFLEMFMQIRVCGLAYNEGDTFLSQVPSFLAYNIVTATNTPLSMGLEVIMLPDYQPSKFADNIYKHKPNHVIAGPADWSNFIENEKVPTRNYSFLKSMISGSDKIDPEQKKRINKLLAACGCENSILEGYGMTEIAAAAILNIPQHNVDDSVGIPLPKVNVCIYDNEKKCELGYGEIGEICMSGPTVMDGYYSEPDATKNVIRRHEDGLYWLHSGDLGYLNSDGNLFLKGRLKRIIIRHDGLKISPFDIEKVLLNNNNVISCCVVGKDDQEHQSGKIAVAYVTIEKDALVNKDIIEQELYQLCNDSLQERYRPKEIHIIDQLPLTPNGKVDYRALEKRI